MSAWGIELFDNDFALDLKTDFIEMLGTGMTIDDIEEQLFKNAPVEADEDECIFWSVLAFLEWEYGLLNDYVKNKAKYIIKNRPDDKLFLDNQKKVKRKMVLENLYRKLDTINPKAKKIKPTFVYRTAWNVGDIYCIEINKQYVYIHIVGVNRINKKIECLSPDYVYIKVFDIVSHELLTIKAFNRKLFRLKYKKLSTDKKKNNYVEQIWCLGKREQKSFEKDIIYIGNKKTKTLSTDSVSIYYQFKVLKQTLKNLFEL